MSRCSSRISVALLVALIAASCGNSGDDGGSGNAAPATNVEIADPEERDTFVALDQPGVTDDEIRFASITTTSGNPLGTNIGGAYNAGIQAYFDYRNDEGGIYGRDLVLAEQRDDELGSNDREAVAVASEDSAFGVFVATLLFTGAATLDEAGIPTFGWNIHAEFADKPSLFGHVAPSCPDCFARVVPYVARELGATTVGVLAYGTSENSRGCAEAQRDSIEHFSGDIGGIEVGFFDNDLAFGLPNGLAAEVSAMKEAGVDFISTCMDLNGMQTLGEELRRQEMDVDMYHPNTYNAEFVAGNAEIFEGDVMVPQFVPFETPLDSPLRDAFFEYAGALDAADEELAMIGWLNAHLAFTGLLAAGPEFDRATVIGALRSLEDYDADGISVPIDWDRQLTIPTDDTPEVDYEQECFSAVRVVDGEFEPFNQESSEPFLCWPMPRDTWSEPVPTGAVP